MIGEKLAATLEFHNLWQMTMTNDAVGQLLIANFLNLVVSSQLKLQP